MTTGNWQLPDDSWLVKADEALSFIDDPDARGLILYRFDGQYLPAIRKARNTDQLFRAWNAFYAYLTARRSRRKIFSLTAQEADDFIEMLVTLLELPHYATE